ncbi:MAG: acyltransferase [Bacteroidetes bacterium]|nr:acyltransferase [Bacteroidota bacterium]
MHNAFFKNDFSNLCIGEDVYIGPHTVLDLYGEITIKNHVAIGMNSHIFTHASFVGTYSMLMRIKVANVVFEEYSGTNPCVTVLAGVTVGRNSYITPHSVAVENIPPYKIVRGNPAQIIANLPEEKMKSFETKYLEKIGWIKS